MKYVKLITCLVLIVSAVMYANAQQDAKLSEEEKRFDMDGNGILNSEEHELMLQVTGLEAFTGDKLGSEEIKTVYRNLMVERESVRREPPRGFGGRGGIRGPGAPEKLVERFDRDKDGKLTGNERKAVLETRHDRKFSRMTPANAQGDIQSDVEASLAATPTGSPSLYAADTLRTLYLRFHDEDWYEQLNAFYRTDVEVPADLVVDGKIYPEVGVHFRGSSSYFTVESEKKSFNIAIDYGNDGQRLYGYKTLNLLNGHVDASFLREVIYNHIARHYIPAMKTNLVKLVINGENWGVYINLQQYNKDFLAEWFDTKAGIRWKVGPGRGTLVYLGDDAEAYREAYQLKTKGVEDVWTDFIALCKLLDESTSNAELEAKLPVLFNIDRALWQLAVSNVFMDDDGYIHKGGDYALYQDVKGMFHLIPHDNNESFRFARGGGRGRMGWSWGDVTGGMASPITHAGNPERPVINRLLSHPQWRARYLAHVRTVIDEWLSWDVIEPVIERYQTLIDAEVQQDDKKLYNYQDFVASTADESFGSGMSENRGGGGASSLKSFITQRQTYLLNHSELNKPTPKIISVSKPEAPVANHPVAVEAVLDKSVAVDSVLLYYGTDRHGLFNHITMARGKGSSFVGEIPAFPAGTTVYYYIEANAVDTHGTTAFSPARAEFGAARYQVRAAIAKDTPVVINELMADNTKSITDPQGQHEDWLELHNLTNDAVLLTGMYLTDKTDNLKKWAFPDDTKIPAHGYLIVWLDEDVKAPDGLHANFKLSRNGETVMLVDSDERGNQVLDKVTFTKQEKNAAFGRWPNGTGTLRQVAMTPGRENMPKE